VLKNTALGVLAVQIAAAQANLIIDTDAGSDDLLAVAFLLTRKEINIEAITVVHGLAHVPAGVRNMQRLLKLGGRAGVPVYAGAARPLKPAPEFPSLWRKGSDELPGVDLPQPSATPPRESAQDFLSKRLRDRTRPVRVLALGPLTNIARALQSESKPLAAVKDMIVMGGAFEVPGNIGDGGYFKTDNKVAEWNIFADPEAARIVLSSALPMTIVPLDATSQVPIRRPFVNLLAKQSHLPLGRFMLQVLEMSGKFIDENIYYAWDPLAAAALVDNRVVRTKRGTVRVETSGPSTGRTIVETPGTALRIALDADRQRFEKLFIAAFQH
jgi:inosine-uridine nucleoside N-ribohydrolase